MNYPALICHYNTEARAIICSEECCSTLVFAQLQGVINYCKGHAHITSTLSSQVLKQGSLLPPRHVVEEAITFPVSFNSACHSASFTFTVCVQVYSTRFKIWEGYSIKGTLSTHTLCFEAFRQSSISVHEACFRPLYMILTAYVKYSNF